MGASRLDSNNVITLSQDKRAGMDMLKSFIPKILAGNSSE